MPKASYAPARPSALALAAFYSFTSSLPTVLLTTIGIHGAIAPAALTQTPDRLAPFPGGNPPPQDNPADAPTRDSAPTSPQNPDSPTGGSVQQQLERARQQLLEREEPLPSGQPSPPQLSLPATSAATSAALGFEAYHLGPGDSLYFNVLKFPDLNFQATLDLQGNVVVPLAGLLPLNGLTLEEARQLVQVQFNRFVVDPQVDITLVAQRPVQVTVSGEVLQPGVYPLSAPQLSIALLSAGGATRFADLRTIRIRRLYPNGSTLERDVDFFTPLRDSGAVPYVRLEDGDVVIVPALNNETIATYDRSLVARSNLVQQQITIRALDSSNTAGRAGAGAQVRTLQLPSGSTFVDAMTAISPNTSQANIRSVALMRFDPIQGRIITLELDAKAATMGNLAQNPQLEDDDVIVIGRNLIGEVTYVLNTLTQPFRDVLGFLLFFENLADSAESLFGPGNSNSDNND